MLDIMWNLMMAVGITGAIFGAAFGFLFATCGLPTLVLYKILEVVDRRYGKEIGDFIGPKWNGLKRKAHDMRYGLKEY